MLTTIEPCLKPTPLVGVLDKMHRPEFIKLLTMQQSTTELLEKLSGKKLKVKTEFQRELYTRGDGELEVVRMVRLYLDDPDYPVIYSITSLPKKTMSPEEFQQVKEGKTPLGKIFKLGESKGVRKKNVEVKTIHDLRMTKRMQVTGAWFFAKVYCLWVGKRKIGSIKEIFNEESFLRIWD